jgi:hypothetical protein
MADGRWQNNLRFVERMEYHPLRLLCPNAAHLRNDHIQQSSRPYERAIRRGATARKGLGTNGRSLSPRRLAPGRRKDLTGLALHPRRLAPGRPRQGRKRRGKDRGE